MLLAQALRLRASRTDAEDLVQEVLLAAVRAGRNEPAWLSGVLRRQAAMAARTAVRRRRREQAAQAPGDCGPLECTGAPGRPVRRFDPLPLPPAARRIALFALHGLDSNEIRWLLQISPAALRQRWTSLRRAVAAMPPPARAALAERLAAQRQARDPRLAAGRLRRVVHAAIRSSVMQQAGPALGTHDPDGHPLLLRRHAHVSGVSGNKQG